MSRSISKHRKVSTSFRDLQLLEIFSVSCNLLKQASSNIININLSDNVQVIIQNYYFSRFF
jgi:exportin-7